MKKFLDYCYHTHTSRCGHAVGEDEQYVIAAINTEYARIGFSDHIMLRGYSQPGIRGDYELIDDYVASINELKEIWKDRIDIIIGFECEYYPQYVEYYKELLSSGKIDYMILGQHCHFINGKMNWYFSDKSTGEDVKLYTDDLIAGMRTGLFKYVAHPDLYVEPFINFTGDLVECAHRICQEALKLDMPLEINLNGFRRISPNRIRLTYPCEAFWKIVGEYGCKVVMGVDAHSPRDFITADYASGFKLIEKYNLNYIDDFRIK